MKLIKLIWHCIINRHRLGAQGDINGDDLFYLCYDCDYLPLI